MYVLPRGLAYVGIALVASLIVLVLYMSMFITDKNWSLAKYF